MSFSYERHYKKFTQKQFEYLMRKFLISEKLGFMKDITEEFLEENETWERIYTITTKNPSVDIMVFSSIDIRTQKVRDNGLDCVRLVLRWKTKYGYRYSKIAKHLRIETLFSNVQKSIEKTQKDVFNLNGKLFTNSV